MKVVVRCRPLNSVERERGDESIVHMDTKLGSGSYQQQHVDSHRCAAPQNAIARCAVVEAHLLSFLSPPADSSSVQFACSSLTVRRSELSRSTRCTRRARSSSSSSTTAPSQSSTRCSTDTMERCSATGMTQTNARGNADRAQPTTTEFQCSPAPHSCFVCSSRSQTGTGKTFSMEGVVPSSSADFSPSSLAGMMPRSFFYVFAGVENQSENMEFLVRGRSHTQTRTGSKRRAASSVQAQQQMRSRRHGRPLLIWLAH